jgi:predicted aconitase with swiveling domain
VTSAIIMEIPLVDQVEPAFYDLIKDGDRIEVDADNEQIIIL